MEWAGTGVLEGQVVVDAIKDGPIIAIQVRLAVHGDVSRRDRIGVAFERHVSGHARFRRSTIDMREQVSLEYYAARIGAPADLFFGRQVHALDRVAREGGAADLNASHRADKESIALHVGLGADVNRGFVRAGVLAAVVQLPRHVSRRRLGADGESVAVDRALAQVSAPVEPNVEHLHVALL